MKRPGLFACALVLVGAIGASSRLWAQAPAASSGTLPAPSAPSALPPASVTAPTPPLVFGPVSAMTAATSSTASAPASAPPPLVGPPPYGLPAGGPSPYGNVPVDPYYASPSGYPNAPPYEDNPPPAPTLEYHEGDPIPQGYGRDTKVRLGLVIGGALVLGVPWLVSAVVAEPLQSVYDTLDDRDEHHVQFWPLFLPLAGPFIAIGTTEASPVGTFVLAADGVVQCGGLAMLIAGLAAPEDVLVWEGPGPSALSLRPASLGGDAWGPALAGRY